MKTDKLITVSEYAKLQGISSAAVYKKLNTTLKTYTVNVPTVNNPKKSQIKLNYAAMLKDGLITVDKKVDENSTTVDNPNITAEYIKTLQEQLRIKDEQIAALTQALADVTRLADQQQILQAHQQQKLLSENAEKPKKQSLFSRLFNGTPSAEHAPGTTSDEP